MKHGRKQKRGVQGVLEGAVYVSMAGRRDILRSLEEQYNEHDRAENRAKRSVEAVVYVSMLEQKYRYKECGEAGCEHGRSGRGDEVRRMLEGAA
jgi:hypothetical protein